MKKYLFHTILLLFTAITANAINASVTYSTFKGPESNLVEIYLMVVGKSVTFQPIDTVLSQAAVDVTLIFTKKDDQKGDKIVKYDRFRLNSPQVNAVQDFADLKRYSLKNGNYHLEAVFEDVNRPDQSVTYETDFAVKYSNSRIQQSDIQLISNYRMAKNGEQSTFIKSGVYMENAPLNFYGRYAEFLIFYNEIYNTDERLNDDFMISYIIDKNVGNNEYKNALIGHKRKSPEPVVVLLQKIDIRELDSGNYRLTVEVRDRNKKLLSKKILDFDRLNPNLDIAREEIAAQAEPEDEFVKELTDNELVYGLRAIAPLVSNYDGDLINRLVAERDPKAMKLYLYSYWASINATNPKKSYEDYMVVARAVDKTYNSGFGYGFESDRGYIFMKYGKPSDVITVTDEPSAPPYEIWTYYDFPQTQQSNVKFLFYNPSLADGQFVLLHSTALSEIQQPQWERMLYLNSPNQHDSNDYVEGVGMQDSFGRQARRLFEDW